MTINHLTLGRIRLSGPLYLWKSTFPSSMCQASSLGGEERKFMSQRSSGGPEPECAGFVWRPGASVALAAQVWKSSNGLSTRRQDPRGET